MKHVLCLLLLLFSYAAKAQHGIRGKQIFKHISFLASDELKGRWPGSAGDSVAEKYIINAFQKAGIEPLFPGYIQPFETTVKLEAPQAENYLCPENGDSLLLNQHYGIFPFSGQGIVDAPLLTGSDNHAIFRAQQQFKSTWVAIWRQKTFAPASDSSSDYALAAKAMQLGAAGVILISPDSLDEKDVLVRLRPRNDKSLGIPVVQITRAAWRQMLHVLRVDGTYNQNDFQLSVRNISGAVRIHPGKVIARNIAGLIKGSDPRFSQEYIVLGAHYDHLGYGGYGTGSLQPDTTAIHNGADDNASGTAALLAIARELERNRKHLKRSIIVVAFAAEEEGLLGSRYFVSHLPADPTAIKAMVNMDMVGRLNTAHQLYMGGAGTFPGGVEFMQSLGEGSGLHLVVHAGGVGGSDHVSFYQKKIPSIGMHTGGHPQYHTPADDAMLINVKGIELVSRYIYRVISGLSVRQGAWDFIQQH